MGVSHKQKYCDSCGKITAHHDNGCRICQLKGECSLPKKRHTIYYEDEGIKHCFICEQVFFSDNPAQLLCDGSPFMLNGQPVSCRELYNRLYSRILYQVKRNLVKKLNDSEVNKQLEGM